MDQQTRRIPLYEGGPEVSRVGFGTYHLGDKLDDAAAIDSFGLAVDAGINLLDLSDNYGTELLLGTAVREGVVAREGLVIATKTGLATSFAEHSEWEKTGKRKDTSRARILKQADKSLRLLGDEVGVIDLYQVHVYDENTPTLEVVTVMNELIDNGKIRAYGVSNYGAVALLNMLDTCKEEGLIAPVTSQPNFHMFSSTESVNTAQDNGLTVLAHSPLMKGVLTTNGLSALSEVLQEHLDNNPEPTPGGKILGIGLERLAELEMYANLNSHSLAELALSWVLDQDALALTACTNPAYIETAIRASEWQIDDRGLELIEEVRGSSSMGAVANLMVDIMMGLKPYYYRNKSDIEQ